MQREQAGDQDQQRRSQEADEEHRVDDRDVDLSHGVDEGAVPAPAQPGITDPEKA
jgi:hypothetical protein